MQLLRRRGFTLIELLVVIAIIGILISLLLPAIRGARRAAQTAKCMSNLRQMMVAHATYSNTYQEYLAAFNGRAEDRSLPHQHDFFPDWPDVTRQALSIIVDQTKRGDTSTHPLQPFNTNGGAGGEVTSPLQDFSHLMLHDFLDGGVLSEVAVCPADAARISWRASPLSMASSPYKPVKSANIANLDWWPYSSSYQLDPAAQTRRASGDPNATTYAQGSSHDQYIFIKQDVFGRRRIDEVGFPSQKAALYDSQDRHVAKRELFFLYPEAKQPIAFYDGSVSVRRTSDSNIGENRKVPVSSLFTSVTSFTYAPDLGFESPKPAKTTGVSIKQNGWYRWTVNDLRGVDFGGRPVDKK